MWYRVGVYQQNVGRWSVYAGARAPEGIELVISTRTGSQVLDVSTVSSVLVDVYRRAAEDAEEPCGYTGQHIVPMGGPSNVAPQTWSTTITSRGCGKVVVSHAFVDGDDVDVPGFLVLCPRVLIAPSGTLRCAPIDLQVVPLV